ncbi:hypothetical protein BV25DRAFT_488548 [Artomyces pyxidatus]|uniref:Uncharacterized protein n=1 Tax=Artomyces pyxidatus TaxID=48021 RepID=A0ACB8T404_9AGAM|nr:hypothetical protein BV25DRAFT_488548 [Artomyces pyxidatus]
MHTPLQLSALSTGAFTIGSLLAIRTWKYAKVPYIAIDDILRCSTSCTPRARNTFVEHTLKVRCELRGDVKIVCTQMGETYGQRDAMGMNTCPSRPLQLLSSA